MKNQNFMPSTGDMKSIGFALSEESEIEGFDMYSYAGINADIAIYQKTFEPAKGTVEYVIQHRQKGIVFIGYVDSFDKLKDQLERCRIKLK